MASVNLPIYRGNLPFSAMIEISEHTQRQLELYEQLGARIKDAADRIGGLQKLAPLLTDVSRRTLSDYVSGKSEPKATTIVEITEATGVTIQWLVSGTGPVSTQDIIQKHRQTIDQEILIEVRNIIATEHAEAGITLSSDNLMRTAVEHYNAMILQAENPGDVDEIRSLLPWMHGRVKRLIAAARAEPGSGKRSGS